MSMNAQDLLNDASLVCTDPAIDAARLNAGGPPPHTCCPMAPDGVENGGKQMELEHSPLAAKLMAELPAPAAVPSCRADFNSGGDLLPDVKPAPAPGVTS